MRKVLMVRGLLLKFWRIASIIEGDHRHVVSRLQERSGKSMKSGAWFLLTSFFLFLTAGLQPVQAAASEFVPRGTILNVRTTQPIGTFTTPGARFRAVVDDPVFTVDGRVAIPRGSIA